MIPLTYSDRFSFWRDAYHGGERFIANNLEKLSEEESPADYQKRIRTAPSPAAAQSIVGRILSAFADRMRLCVRYGAAIDTVSEGRGIDNLGSSVNGYLTELAKELALVGKVGVAVSTPKDLAVKADNANAHPYCITVRAENIRKTEPAPAGSPSIWGLVEWQSEDAQKVYRMTLEGGKVFWQVEEKGVSTEPTEIVGLTQIPFVLVQAESLMAKLAPHEVALTNLLSVLSTNSPDLVQAFLARQISSPFADPLNMKVPVTFGRERGITYGPKENAPTYVAPAAGPFTEARQIVEALIARMNELVGLSGDTEAERIQSIASVAGKFGDALEIAERQIWRHAAAYGTETGVRETPVTKYPKWQAETETERLSNINTKYELAQLAPGRNAMEGAMVLAVEQHFAGESSKDLQAVVKAVKDATCLASSTDAIRAKEAKVLTTAAAADSLGCKESVAKEAIREAQVVAMQLATAAALATKTKQADRTVGGVGSDRDAELADKALSQQNGEVRGESK